jgi:hypothetical protein
MAAMSWAVGGRLLLQRPGRQQVQAGAHLRSGDHGIWASPWPRAAWQSAHISTVNSPSTLKKGPPVEPQKEQRSAIGLRARSDARQMLCRSRPAVSRLSAGIPCAASRRTVAPGFCNRREQADVAPCEAARGLAEGRAWPDTEGVKGSNPVAPTIPALTSRNASVSSLGSTARPHESTERVLSVDGAGVKTTSPAHSRFQWPRGRLGQLQRMRICLRH